MSHILQDARRFRRFYYLQNYPRCQSDMQFAHGACQWRSQALKSGWAQGSPSGVQGRSSGGGMEAKQNHIQTVFTCQMLFYTGLLPSPPSISPIPLKSSSDIRESHDPTRPGHNPQNWMDGPQCIPTPRKNDPHTCINVTVTRKPSCR